MGYAKKAPRLRLMQSSVGCLDMMRQLGRKHWTKEKSFCVSREESPKENPLGSPLTGKACGVQVYTIEDPLMRTMQYLDKLIDELA
jgi:hypothetical protein